MKINVGVVFGGRSVENEISVITAQQTIEALDKNKYEITPIYIAKSGKWYSGDALFDVANYKDIPSLLKRCDEVFLRPSYGDNNLYRVKRHIWQREVVTKIDVILPALHGTNCEDGSFQGGIELTGIPYAGCNPLASANGMDKITMKMILKESAIPTVDYCWFSDKEWFAEQATIIERIESHLTYPLIVKPANLGSSVGIKAVHNRAEMSEAIDTAITYSKRIIVEYLIEDLKEINCSVLGNYYENEASVCEAPVRSGEILSYEDKYLGGAQSGKGCKGGLGCKNSRGMESTIREIPAILPQATTDAIRRYAVETFKVLACDGVARIDFMIDRKSDKVYVNEINTIPGSLSFYLWEASGVTFAELVDRLIEIAFQRKRDSDFKITSYDENIFSYQTTGSKMGGGKMGGKMGRK